VEHYSKNFQLTANKILRQQVRQWLHLADETCGHSLTAIYNINRPVKLMCLTHGLKKYLIASFNTTKKLIVWQL